MGYCAEELLSFLKYIKVNSLNISLKLSITIVFDCSTKFVSKLAFYKMACRGTIYSLITLSMVHPYNSS